ncbi:hypothetical protein KK062_30615, partial [Fulvivirgaceae bacterium PWU5]|nr:hypothetical protein [Dawidia cretensis]
IHHHLIKVSAFSKLKGLGRITFLYGGQYNQREEYDIRRAGRSERPALSLNLISNVVDVSIDHEKEKHSGSFGLNGTVKANT